MAKPLDHPQFRELKMKWDQILAETGLEDLEDEWGNLKQRASNAYRGADAVTREAKLQFFTQVSQYTAHAKFPNKLERFIMESLGEGVKQVDIRLRLAEHGIRIHRVTIYRIIQKWLKAWNLR